MGRPLRVLIVEDSEDDALLILREIRRGGYEPISERMDTAEGMTEALQRGSWDLVISDYVLPRFSGIQALRIMKDRGMDLPFIIVSGKADEETLVAAMKAGVHDYVMKRNLSRLVPAMQRELGEAVTRREKRKAEEEKERNLSLLLATLDATADGILVVDREERVTIYNRKFLALSGIPESLAQTRDDALWLEHVLSQLKDPEGFLARIRHLYRNLEEESLDLLELKNGRIFERYSQPQWVGGKIVGRVWSFRDITELRKAERELKRSETLLKEAESINKTGGWEWNIEQQTMFWTDGAYRIHDFQLDEVEPDARDHIARSLECYDPQDRQKILSAFKNCAEKGEPYDLEFPFTTAKGRRLWIRTSAQAVREQDQIAKVVGNIQDITERKRMEDDLKKSEQEARRMARENASLAEIGRIVSSTLDIDLVYERFAQEAKKLINFDRISINFIDRENNNNTLIVNYVWGTPVDGRESKDVIPFIGSATEEVFKTRLSLLIQTEDEDELAARLPAYFPNIKAGLRSAMFIPLFVRDEVIGSVSFLSKKFRAYTDRDRELGENIGLQIAGAIANAQLFAALKQAEESLRREKDKAQQYLDIAAVILVVIDANQKVSLINKMGCRTLGYKEEEIIGKNWFETFLPESNREKIKKVFALLMAGLTKSVDYFENDILTKNGEKRNIAWRNTLLRDQRGHVVGTLSSGLDITESKAAAEELSQKTALLSGLLDSLPDRVFFKDHAGIYLGCNPEFSRFVGCSREEIVGRTDDDLFPPEKAAFYRQTDRITIEQGKPRRIESWIDYPDGSQLLSDTIKTPLRSVRGETIGLVGVSRDITELKRAEERILASLREKEVLLKEVHHRVKNNLQIISSLLNMQSRSIQDPRILEVFRESQNRVRSLALVHERLYRSPDLARVDFGEYIRSLVSSLFASYSSLTHGIAYEIDAGETLVGVDLAIPCGLVLNELVSNALKHAFPGGRRGKISIAFHRREKGPYVLRVKDNGAGFHTELDIGNTPTLGMQLVDTLTKQLAGTLELNRAGGTEFTLTFGDGNLAGEKHG